jgi:hypothetical protein
MSGGWLVRGIALGPDLEDEMFGRWFVRGTFQGLDLADGGWGHVVGVTLLRHHDLLKCVCKDVFFTG